MVLDIDVGNSRVKWRLAERPEMAGSCDRGELGALLALTEQMRPERIRVASVADRRFDQALSRRLGESCGVAPEFAETTASVAGLHCGYEQPWTMGVDRWLALLAAWSRTREPTLVVDAGTAVTIDAATVQGRHLGGYILPGLRLMQRSLGQETAEVRVASGFESGWPWGLELGRNTREAVQHGLLRMLLALIEDVARELAGRADAAPWLYLCGGDARLLAARLQRPHVLDEALVLDGLAIAMP